MFHMKATRFKFLVFSNRLETDLNALATMKQVFIPENVKQDTWFSAKAKHTV